MIVLTNKLENKFNISEIVFISIMATAMGIFWWAYTFLYNILAPLLKLFAIDGLLSGIWLMGGLFFPYIIRKPGAAILGEGIASMVECVISQWGIGAIFYGIIQGVPIELFFLLLRYKKWNTTTMLIAGLISGIAGFVLSIFWYQYYKLGLGYNIIQLLAHTVSGAILAGLLSKLLADKLVKTGVLNHFNIVRQALVNKPSSKSNNSELNKQ